MTTATDERLDFAERWLRDGLQVVRPALMVHQVVVDTTHAMQRLAGLRRSGVQATTTHLIVYAVARALAANPDLHQVIAGNRRHRPSHVDIGLAITAEKFVGSPLVIEAAELKTVPEIAAEVARRAPEVQRADRELNNALRRWGWLVPFGFMRRAVLRLLFTSPRFRRKGAGTFQVSTVPGDWALSAAFASAGVLVAGQISSRVVAVNGQPAVRPMMTLTLSGDHGIWHGQAAARFLSAVKAEVESEQEVATLTA